MLLKGCNTELLCDENQKILAGEGRAAVTHFQGRAYYS